MTIKEASEITKIPEQTLRVMLQRGMVDFGMAILRDGCKRHHYVLFEKKVNEFAERYI